jgi:plasmid stabilization system protein ParE
MASMLKIKWTNAALYDLEDAVECISKDNPLAAQNVGKK